MMLIEKASTEWLSREGWPWETGVRGEMGRNAPSRGRVRIATTYLLWEMDDTPARPLAVVLDSMLAKVVRSVPSRHGQSRPQVMGTDRDSYAAHSALPALPGSCPAPALGHWVSEYSLHASPLLLSHLNGSTATFHHFQVWQEEINMKQEEALYWVVGRDINLPTSSLPIPLR